MEAYGHVQRGIHSDMQMQIACPTTTVALFFVLQLTIHIVDAKSIGAHSKMDTHPR
jgi:hypothetical protein